MDKEKVFYELMETLYETSRLISSYENIPRKYGTEDELYMIEVHTLNLIGDQVKTNTSEIADLTNRTKSAVSQMVDKLIKKDLAFKYRNPDNYRELTIELTPKGKLVYEYHKKLDEEEYGSHLKNLEQFTVEDFQNYITILNVINRRTRKVLNDRD
ncbi:MarR family winged helix-turn-helix transcriptional regulator [Lysinibacillus sp. NPDC097279]|uniref:MarR family winged helix-turn-helix transcriptional regulator n=1 Tax=unclassified Lysinibacillus TaxID=2636778 RepID=UPI00116BDE5F|nr:MarR family transcriptional regulator [Lysinibacillus sp. CD3-6]QPQ35730.1 winged helix DNA-binding protein [Lysinibacillus sp. JNUCC-52]UED78156.1 winged helix DNA-binding protein [Lysinibacillus sp. CD3-6]